ncbi:MAG: undecaprenyldiphospho-muramoylpentapeptide beta-N-acetylglucosaminyltransferase [Bacteroides sp.]
MELRIIISGGGTGGHIFPALSIANAIKEIRPDARILFVGAEGRMEMHRVPAAGYEIIGLPISGFDRKHLWKNIAVLCKLVHSQWKARHILRKFRPQVAVGVGGYASGPTLKTAGMMGIPTLIQEQNSYAGVTNKLLAKTAKKICVAYPGMEKFFPAEKILLTGNPVRQELLDAHISPTTARQSFGLQTDRKTVLVLGGSLGARSLNQAFMNNLPFIRDNNNVQFIWQTGKIYLEQVQAAVTKAIHTSGPIRNLYVTDFLPDMATAYAAADLVVSRAGAGSISEFCLLGKAVILVPSPNVAEDHQTKNALALVDKQAAICIKDADAAETLVPQAVNNVKDEAKLTSLREHIAKLAYPHSATLIAQEIIKLAQQ